MIKTSIVMINPGFFADEFLIDSLTHTHAHMTALSRNPEHILLQFLIERIHCPLSVSFLRDLSFGSMKRPAPYPLPTINLASSLSPPSLSVSFSLALLSASQRLPCSSCYPLSVIIIMFSPSSSLLLVEKTCPNIFALCELNYRVAQKKKKSVAA